MLTEDYMERPGGVNCVCILNFVLCKFSLNKNKLKIMSQNDVFGSYFGPR
jgi:hypothetical protein